VAPGGYAWWYVDALSPIQPDGSAHALTVIAFVGSVFSPYYAWARRRHGDAGVSAEAHCAINVSLYWRAPRSTHFERLWAMTERNEPCVARDATTLRVGPSRLAWASDGLHLDIDEWTAPWPQRLRGHIHLRPLALPGRAFTLDPAQQHRWQPIAPMAVAEVNFNRPRLRWNGEAYLDTNHGSRPLERDFTSWQWSRASDRSGGCRIHYDVEGPDRRPRSLALQIDRMGRIELGESGPLGPLPATAWGVPRSSPALNAPRLVDTLESGPFYARSLLACGPEDAPSLAVHESLSLQRFAQPWVQVLLPFRMPRRARARPS
jgi:carotenoid 1,2-hydratase